MNEATEPVGVLGKGNLNELAELFGLLQDFGIDFLRDPIIAVCCCLRFLRLGSNRLEYGVVKGLESNFSGLLVEPCVPDSYGIVRGRDEDRGGGTYSGSMAISTIQIGKCVRRYELRGIRISTNLSTSTFTSTHHSLRPHVARALIRSIS